MPAYRPMGSASPSLFVSVVEQAAFVKITGRANFASSVTFKTLVQELEGRSCTRFVLDLTDCVTMDSTFLGVLSGLALRVADQAGGPAKTHLVLLNPNARVMDLLENLGVHHLFKVSQSSTPQASPQTPVQETKPSREEISRTCLEAHNTLMAINPENIPRFKEVTQFLAEDLKKMKPSG